MQAKTWHGDDGLRQEGLPRGPGGQLGIGRCDPGVIDAALPHAEVAGDQTITGIKADHQAAEVALTLGEQIGQQLPRPVWPQEVMAAGAMQLVALPRQQGLEGVLRKVWSHKTQRPNLAVELVLKPPPVLEALGARAAQRLQIGLRIAAGRNTVRLPRRRGAEQAMRVEQTAEAKR